MSLETLLEAAEFVELKHHGSAKSRGHELKKFHQYAKSGPPPPRDRKRKSESSGRYTNDDDDSDRQKSDDSWVFNRDVHNKLEKHRRAQMKDCFENLKRHIPGFEEKKASSLAILRSGVRHIQALKKREKELQQHLQSLSNRKSLLLERARRVKEDLAEMGIEMNVSELPQQSDDDEDTRSASTATADGEYPFVSDDEQEQHMLYGFPKLANQEAHVPHFETAHTTRVDGEEGKAHQGDSGTKSPRFTKPSVAASLNGLVIPTKTNVNHLLHQTIVQRSLQHHKQQPVADKALAAASSDKHLLSSSASLIGQQKSSPQAHLQSAAVPLNQHLPQTPLLNTSGSKQNLQLIISPDVLQQLLVQHANSKSANASDLNTLAQLLPSLASNSTLTPKKEATLVQRNGNANGANNGNSSSVNAVKMLVAQDSSSSFSSVDSSISTIASDGAAAKTLVMPSIRQPVLPTPGSQLLTPLQLAQVAPVLFAQSQHSHLAQGVTMRQVSQILPPVVTQAQKVAAVQPAMIALSGAQILSPLTFVAPGLQVISGFQQSGLMAGLTNSVSATAVSLPSNILQQASVIPILNHSSQTVPVVQTPLNLQSGQQQFIVVSLPNAIANSSLATVINSGNVNLS